MRASVLISLSWGGIPTYQMSFLHLHLHLRLQPLPRNLPNTSIVCMLHGRHSSRVNHVKRSRSKIRASEQVFNPGDKVYYKRDNQERWLGPAKVIFQDGKVVFVRHGAVWIKVSPNRLVKSGKEFRSVSSKINSPLVHDDDLRSEDDSDWYHTWWWSQWQWETLSWRHTWGQTQWWKYLFKCCHHIHWQPRFIWETDKWVWETVSPWGEDTRRPWWPRWVEGTWWCWYFEEISTLDQPWTWLGSLLFYSIYPHHRVASVFQRSTQRTS